jgi:hypothetical protein
MEAAAATPAKPFDFAAMSKVVTSSARQEVIEDDRPPAEDVIVTPETSPAESKEEVKPEDDEDDLVVGNQLDSVGTSASVSPDTVTPPAPSSADGGASSADDAPSESEIGTRGSADTLQNPMDPRMAALASAGRQEMEQRQQERGASPAGGRGGPGGLGIGAALGAGIAGTFKLLGNGLRAVHNPDPSKPTPMGVMERRAARDPVKAAEYYNGKGDKVLSEKYYRDQHGTITAGMSSAKAAELEFQTRVTDFNEFLQQSPVAPLAAAAQSSVGDFIHDVKSGTIKDAAAKSVVATLQQDPAFLSAEKGVLEAASGFKQKVGEVTKALDSVDAAFPGRMDTNLRRQQIADMASGMQNDEVAKASSKIKQTMDELSRLAEAIKKVVMDVVHSVGSAFKPK